MRKLLLVGLVGCGGASYDFEPRTTSFECYSLDCPIALGAELVTTPVVYSDDTELAKITHPSVAPPGIADIELRDRDLVITARQLGPGSLGAVFDGEERVDRPIRIMAVAATTAVPTDDVLRRAYPQRDWGALAVYADTTLWLAAEHRSSDGQLLLGHGIEQWSAIGAELAAPPDDYDYGEPTLLRSIHPIAPGLVSVVATDHDAPLDLEVVAAGAAGKVELFDQRHLAPGESLRFYTTNEMRGADVLAYTPDGRYLLGDAVMTVTSSDPSVVSVESAASRRFQLLSHARGHSKLAVTFDGVTAIYDLQVGE